MAAHLPDIVVTDDVKSADFDAVIVVSPNIQSISIGPEVKEPLEKYASVDKAAEAGVFVVPCDLPAKKIVFSGTGALTNEWDDVRNYAGAAKAGVKKALDTGSKAPLLYFNVTKYPQADVVSILGALEANYVPLEMREQVPEKAVKLSKLGILGDGSKVDLAKALEAGRIVSRDIGGSDPERMAAPR